MHTLRRPSLKSWFWYLRDFNYIHSFLSFLSIFELSNGKCKISSENVLFGLFLRQRNLFFDVDFNRKDVFTLIDILMVYILIYTFDMVTGRLPPQQILPWVRVRVGGNLSGSNFPSTIWYVNCSVYILVINTFSYCALAIYIPFILFKSNRVWFGKYKSGISFVS